MLVETLQKNWSNAAYDEKITSLWRGATFEEQSEAIEFLLTSGPILVDKEALKGTMPEQAELSFDVYISPLKYLLRQVNKGAFYLNEDLFLIVKQAVFYTHLRIYAVSHEKQLEQALCETLAAHFDSTIREIIAFRHNLSKLVIESLACDHDPNVRRIVALRDDLPQHVRAMLAKDEDKFVRMDLEDPRDARIIMNAAPIRLVVSRIPANTRLLHKKVLELTRDPNVYNRQRLAAWDKLPEDIIRILLNDKAPLVRSKLAEYRDLPYDVTEQLVYDEDEAVRTRIAVHGKLSQQLMEILANDKHASVRYNIALRSHLPATVMQQLANDGERDIRHTIAVHEDVCWEWL